MISRFPAWPRRLHGLELRGYRATVCRMVLAGAVERIRRLDDAVYEDALEARATLIELRRAAMAVQVAGVAFAALCLYHLYRRQP